MVRSLASNFRSYLDVLYLVSRYCREMVSDCFDERIPISDRVVKYFTLPLKHTGRQCLMCYKLDPCQYLETGTNMFLRNEEPTGGYLRFYSLSNPEFYLYYISNTKEVFSGRCSFTYASIKKPDSTDIATIFKANGCNFEVVATDTVLLFKCKKHPEFMLTYFK